MAFVFKPLIRQCLALLALVPLLSQAEGVQVVGTRFIYEAGARNIVVNLVNNSHRPSLVQAWLDGGDPTTQPGVEQLPFAVLPPLTRVDAGKGQSLRIVHVGGALPQDRESVLWLNVLDIPPKAQKTEGKNIMQLAFRSRLKVFYRPKGLVGSPLIAAQGLSWHLVSTGKTYALRASNPSVYNVSFSRVKLKAGGQAYVSDTGGMVAPLGSQDFAIKKLTSAVSSGEVEGQWIDDYGAARTINYTLKR